MSAPGTPTPLLRRPLYACAGAAFVLAGAGVAAWNAVERFEHGWWLVSFLVLVGGVAQILLGLGQRDLGRHAPRARARRAAARQAALWNAGTLLVPLGVLAHARLPVVIGSVALLTALGSLTLDVRRARAGGARRPGREGAALPALVAFLGASVLVGTALAWDLPWT